MYNGRLKARELGGGGHKVLGDSWCCIAAFVVMNHNCKQDTPYQGCKVDGRVKPGHAGPELLLMFDDDVLFSGKEHYVILQANGSTDPAWAGIVNTYHVSTFAHNVPWC